MEQEVKTKEIEINGVLMAKDGRLLDVDTFWHEFVGWMEVKGYAFGGSIGPYDENDLPH